MPNFIVNLAAFSTILPSCLDIILIFESQSVAKQSSLNHVSLFTFGCTNLIHGYFVPDPQVFVIRNFFALTVSLANCFARLFFITKNELKREIYLDTFSLWAMAGMWLYACSGIDSKEDMITKLALLVGAANNFNVYCSIFPLIVYHVINYPEKPNRFTFVELFPLVVNSANSIISVMYSMSDVNGINFYSNMIACFMCMITYILFFNHKKIHVPHFCSNAGITHDKIALKV